MDWVRRLKKNDLSAFDDLYDATKKPLFYAIYAILKDDDITQDIMQEVYIELLENVGKLKDDINLEGYLVTSAKNKAIDYYNSNKRKMEFAEKCKPYSYSKDKYYDTGLLKVIKETLTEKEFEIFVLKVLGEYSFKEISEMKDIPIGTLTWMYQVCREKLQDKLKGVKNDY